MQTEKNKTRRQRVSKHNCPLCAIWKFISTSLRDSLCKQCSRRLLIYRDPIIAYLLFELKFVKAKIIQIEKLTGMVVGDKTIARKIKEELYEEAGIGEKPTEQGQEGKKISAEGKDTGPPKEKEVKDEPKTNGS